MPNVHNLLVDFLAFTFLTACSQGYLGEDYNQMMKDRDLKPANDNVAKGHDYTPNPLEDAL